MENLKFNKLLNEKYYLLQDIARKYNYSEELLDMITFTYVAFYMDYGKRVDLPLYDLFERIRIIYEPRNVGEIALRHGFGQMPSDTAAITYFKPNYKVFKNPELKQNPQTIIMGTHVGDYLATPAFKLEMLTHEVRHSLMSYYNTNKLLDENTYYMRSGLQESFYKIKDLSKEVFFDEDISVTLIGRTLDEILNTYISELLINRIKSFTKYNIDNSNLMSYVKSIKTKHTDNIYRAGGYNEELRLFCPVLYNQMFIDFVNEHQFIGNIELIKEFIEKLTDKIDYLGLCNLLDTINENNLYYAHAAQNGDMDFVNEHIKNIYSAKEIILDMQKNLTKKNC